MRKVFLLIAVLFSLTTYAQNISGLYSGTLYNDTTKQTQKYELGLSEYRGKITGYAYATFITNDTFYYSIRRVKARREADQLVVEDVAMLANNFPEGPNKGVRRISYIPLKDLGEGDTLSTFKGDWETTKTKVYYSLKGVMDMKRDNDSANSALIAHLEELDIIKKPSYQDAVATTAGAKKQTNKPTSTTAANTESKKDATKTATAAADNREVKVKTKGDDVKVKVEKANNKQDANTVALSPVVPYNQRKQQPIQNFAVQSDSLVLSFYDNGVVDGDIISVYLNGENIIANSKLTASATKKTVYLNSISKDEIELVLVAENLGSLPPNTGLLVVQDGANRYDVRFSADLQTNAAIVFKKRKP